MEITVKDIGGKEYVYVEGQVDGIRQTVYCGSSDKTDSWNKAFQTARDCPYQARAFISHAVENADTVDAIRKLFTQIGVYPYIAVNHPNNINLTEKIRNDIKNSDMLVVLLTAEALRSPTVNNEIGIALEQRKEIVVLKSSSITIPPLLQGREYVNYDEKDPSASLTKVLNLIVKLRERIKSIKNNNLFGLVLLGALAIAAANSE